MGRGRAKAKQTKVARRLKYTTTGTDLDRLREELTGASDAPADLPQTVDDETASDESDEYDEYDDDDETADRAG